MSIFINISILSQSAAAESGPKAGWILLDMPDDVWLVGCYYSVARVRVLVTADFIETKSNKPNI